MAAAASRSAKSAARRAPARRKGAGAGPRGAAPPRIGGRRPGPVAGSEAEANRYIAAYIMGVANRLASGASSYYRKHFDLGMTEWRALMAIGTSTHRIVREVAEMADLDYAAASKSLKVLQQRGLVAIEQTQSRGRAAIASLRRRGSTCGAACARRRVRASGCCWQPSHAKRSRHCGRYCDASRHRCRR